MADVVIAHSADLFGEPLTLLQRKHWVGRYELDLLFEDRHGAHLIMELQRGALDRYHLYKVLDYYDEYKDRHPEQFVEVLVVANLISPERKERLARRGIEYLEVPEATIVRLLAAGGVQAASEQSAAAAEPVSLEPPQPLPDAVARALAEAADDYQRAQVAFLAAHGVDMASGRPVEANQRDRTAKAVADAVASAVRKDLEGLANWGPWTPDRTTAAQAWIAHAFARRKGDLSSGMFVYPIDQVARSQADVCISEHLSALMRPGATAVVESLETLAEPLELERMPRSLRLLLSHTTVDTTAAAWLENRRRLADEFVQDCLAAPVQLSTACLLLGPWSSLIQEAQQHPATRDVDVDTFRTFFVVMQGILNHLCAEALWRISLRLHKTRAVVIGVGPDRQFVSRPYDLPINEKAKLRFFQRLAYFWACPPTVQRLWKAGDVLVGSTVGNWQDSTGNLYPRVEDPGAVISELLVSAYRDKAYTVTTPSEVLLDVGDVRSITLLEAGARQAVYKVMYADRTVAFGSLGLEDAEEGALVITHVSTELLTRAVVEDPAREAILAREDAHECALVAAIVRDFFVCEDRERFYRPINTIKQTRRPAHAASLTVRYLPRTRVRYIGIREREFQEQKVRVVGHSVSGHLRRVRIAGHAAQLALAREYSVYVPPGFTFVRPHQRGSHDHVIFRSRSALQLVYGGAAEPITEAVW